MLTDLLDFQEYPRITKVISGGQTGADRAGLVAAMDKGVATGGHAPKGYRTQTGPDFTLRDTFGLEEHPSDAYPPRTEANVRNAHATIIFGDENSPGCSLTKRLCRKWKKPYFVVNTFSSKQVEEVAKALRALAIFDLTVNVAGNREEKNPGIFKKTRSCMVQLLTLMNDNA